MCSAGCFPPNSKLWWISVRWRLTWSASTCRVVLLSSPARGARLSREAFTATMNGDFNTCPGAAWPFTSSCKCAGSVAGTAAQYARLPNSSPTSWHPMRATALRSVASSSSSSFEWVGREARSFWPPSRYMRAVIELLAEQHVALPPLNKAPRVIGIDDFAFKKGLRYGTVITNLETGRAIDLLPDRKAATVIEWLALHPEIEVISRDRSTEYERASREGASQAVQVLDRWHVLKNFREALERQLKRSQQTLADITKAFVPVSPPRRSLREETARRTRYQRRCAEVAQIKSLAAQGQFAAQIARDLRRSHHFVRFNLRVEKVPETRHPPRESRLDPYHERLWELWNAGERNAMARSRQVRQEGFSGGYKAVHQWTLSRRIKEAEQSELPTEAVPPRGSPGGDERISSRDRWSGCC